MKKPGGMMLTSVVAKHTRAFLHASAIAHTEVIPQDVALAAVEIPGVLHVLKTNPRDISLQSHEEWAMLFFGMVTHNPYCNLTWFIFQEYIHNCQQEAPWLRKVPHTYSSHPTMASHGFYGPPGYLPVFRRQNTVPG